jgi:MFS family permease
MTDCLLSVNNFLGRRGVIFVSANFCLWPVIGSAFCHAWPEQLACRLLMGIGMGIKASTGKIHKFPRSTYYLAPFES